MEGRLSKTQVDRLGERLRGQAYSEDDLRLLDEYRRTFGPVYDQIVEKVENLVGVPVSGRPAKSTTSIIEKLNRESIRLSQVQDIAGCRAVVSNVLEQDRAVRAIAAAFEDVSVLDRRAKPSHGYRAVHVVVRDRGKAIEVQVRTALQHVWAEMSEKLADIADPSIKYGGGPVAAQETLGTVARMIIVLEEGESMFSPSDKFAEDLAKIRDAYAGFLKAVLKQMNETGWDVSR
jgi:ppGpp synthetase/RelA/SpoT-type nucleotidyltranferase